MTEANSRQVGGSHYGGTSQQHWDLVINTRMGYFEGQVSKYVMRWRKKNGVQDLQKAAHFLQKLTENVGVYAPGRIALAHSNILIELWRYSKVHDWTDTERDVLFGIATWQDSYDLGMTRAALTKLIDEAETERLGSPADGGHHARQQENN